MPKRSGGGALARPEQQGHQMMKTIAVELARKKQFLAAMLPKEITPERLRALVLTSFQRNPALMKCSVPSILGAVYEAAKIGLEPDTVGQECHLIPYMGKATFQLGFKGMMKLARRGQTQQIWSACARARDEFDFEMGTDPFLKHRIPKNEDHVPWSEEQRGDIVAAYACARFKDGYVQFRVVLRDDIKRAKAAAQTNNVWQAHPEAMWEKTAIKRLCKLLPMQDVVMRAVELDDLAETNADQNLETAWKAAPADDGGSDQPVDAEYEEAEDPADPDAHYAGD